MTVQKAGVAAALPFLLNPATVGVVAIGAVGWGLYKILCDEDEVEETENAAVVISKPKEIMRTPAREATKVVPGELQVCSQSAAPVHTSLELEGDLEIREEAHAAERKEIVRQAMSELGKRSAAARARRKAALSGCAEAEL